MSPPYGLTSTAAVLISALSLLGCGGTTTTTVTNESTVTLPAETTTVTVRASKPKPKPKPQGSGQTFSGNGMKNLGTLTIEDNSTLRWTNDGMLFQIFTGGADVWANSQAHSGDTALDSGTYTSVKVNAIGNWTMRITTR